jgi:DNA-binding NarL/FixJ family response regulator
LVGRALASANDPSPDSLAPRLRQTLACLLEGDSEKQIAARLRLSHATVHQYVTTLYRRFGVQSRGQLLSYVMKRKDRWRAAALPS